jgi:HlyD family secretion protein
MTRKKKIWLGVILVVVVGGVTAAVIKKNRPKLEEVTIQKIQRKDLLSKVSANGKIEAQRKVDLSANVMGQIVNLAVREGEVVEKGDFLLQIDQAQLAASAAGAEASVKALLSDRDSARASAAEARRTYERAQKSLSDEIIPQSELDRTEAAVDSAEAAVVAIGRRIEQARAGLAGARDTLSKTKMIAPMSGIVTRLPVEEGEVAVIGTMNNPGTVLMTISDMSVVEAVMEVDETDVPLVRLGQTAAVTVDAYENQIFEGVVTEVGSSPIQSLTGAGSAEAVNFEVKIQLTNPPEGIRPGFSSSADILTGTLEQALALPIQALVIRDRPEEEDDESNNNPIEEEGVYAFDAVEKTISFVVVETGMTGETEIEIVSGLSEGEEIVTGPFRALREIEDGDKVELKEDGKGKKGKRDKD